MASVKPSQYQQRLKNRARGLAVLGVCLLLGACASTDGPPPLSLGETTSVPKSAKQVAEAQTELQKATDWWGRKYAENTRDLQAALSYARNLKAMGEKERALAVLQQAAIFHGESKELASEYGRLALDMDQVNVANRLLALADDPINPDWRVVSARGTVLAKQGKYADAIPFYERALSLAHDQPSVMSNLALARAMNGEPAKAEQLLRQAAASDPSSLKIRQNLALVLGLQGKYDEAKQVASIDLPADKVAENTEYLRRVVKVDPQKSQTEAAPQIPAEIPVARAAPIPRAPQQTTAPNDAGSWAAKVAHTHSNKPATKALAAKDPAKPAAKASSAAAQVAAALKPGILPTPSTPPAAGTWATQVALSETAKK